MVIYATQRTARELWLCWLPLCWQNVRLRAGIVEVPDSSADKMNFSDLKNANVRILMNSRVTARDRNRIVKQQLFVLGRTRQHTQACVHKTHTSRQPRITFSMWGLMYQSEAVSEYLLRRWPPQKKRWIYYIVLKSFIPLFLYGTRVSFKAAQTAVGAVLEGGVSRFRGR